MWNVPDIKTMTVPHPFPDYTQCLDSNYVEGLLVIYNVSLLSMRPYVIYQFLGIL